jgi:hypothetical protein
MNETARTTDGRVNSWTARSRPTVRLTIEFEHRHIRLYSAAGVKRHPSLAPFLVLPQPRMVPGIAIAM